MLKPEELRELTKTDALKSWASILLTWGLIVLTFALAIYYPNPLVWLVAFVLMARHQLSLSILMHDAAHKRLFKDITWNDYLGQFLLASPVLFSLTAYRNFHLKHHQDPLAPDDPDLSLTGGYPIPRASFYRKLFRDITGQSYFKFIKYFISKSRSEKSRSVKSGGVRTGPNFQVVVASMVAANLLIWGALAVSGHGWLYLTLWLLPTMTMLQVLLRIRGVAEHAGYQQNDDQRLNARTIINPLQTFFFAPNNVNYHIEHHVYPSIPWYNLPKVHKLMMERGSIPAPNFYRSYGPVLKEILR